jgi:TRAP-type C4-dicarboxylate transport system substrate-binding protein
MVDLGVNTGPMCIMNLERWKKLPDDVKQVFEQVMKEMPEKGKQLTIDYEAASIKEAGAMGITMIPFPDRQKWIDSLPDIRAQWKDDMAKKGMGQEAEDIIKLWDQAISRVRKK